MLVRLMQLSKAIYGILVILFPIAVSGNWNLILLKL